MKLLVKVGRQGGLAAHIPDLNGKALCNIKIKVSDWEIRDLPPAQLVVCRHCRMKASSTACIEEAPETPDS